MALANDLDRFTEDCQIGQAEKVHLEQTDLGDRLHSELGSRESALFLTRRALQREMVDKRIGRDHDSRRMRPGMARNTFQLFGAIDQPA